MESNNQTSLNEDKPIRYKVKECPSDFMSSQEAVGASAQLIDSLLHLQKDQEGVDQWYDRLIQIIHQEMNNHFKCYIVIHHVLAKIRGLS